MKKTAIFLIMFLFFSAVAAETVSNEAIPQENTDNETAAKDESVQTEEAPKKFYFQPALGVGTGASVFRTNLSMDLDFLLKRSKSGVGVYMGLDFDLRYATLFWDNLIELAFQANGVLDMDMKNQPHLKSLSIWLSFGFLMSFEDDYEDGYELAMMRPAWGFGTDLVFKNDMILKLGLDAFLGFYPDLTVAVGYRF
ncbi:hypothetical protein J5681_05335 [bacterium]|nr:hypothetical protein [bacterium]